MIRFKLQAVAERLGKSIADIARETKLNRNTVMALYHGRIDGIRFDTLERLCQQYGLTIPDLLEITPEDEQKTIVADAGRRLYCQEGAIVPFTGWSPIRGVHRFDAKYFPRHIHPWYGFFKNDYGLVYWDHDEMWDIARTIFRRYRRRQDIQVVFEQFQAAAAAIQTVYRTTTEADALRWSKTDICTFFNQFCGLYDRMWSLSEFIDDFDSGFDQEQIALLAKQHGLTVDEITTLTTPETMGLDSKRQLALLELAEHFRRTRGKKSLAQFIKTDPIVEQYRQDFDFFKSSYAVVHHLTSAQIERDLRPLISNPAKSKKDMAALKTYGETRRKNTAMVLRRHHLETNPLWFFALLTEWREERKQSNLIGTHVLDLVLLGIENHTGIPKKYLMSLVQEEVELVLNGLVSRDVLRGRFEDGMFVEVTPDQYQVHEGREAVALHEEVRERLRDAGTDATIITGHVASQGYAKGIARIIMDASDFPKVKTGDIIVTGMTRPEHVPIMKKSGGIVTNEGGITCHAAIVSRELGKPCVIGTKNATSLIHDGDLIEVRAFHGTVRVLQRHQQRKSSPRS